MYDITSFFYFPQIKLTFHPFTKSLKYKRISDRIDNSSDLHQVSIIWLIQIHYTVKEIGDLLVQRARRAINLH